MVFIIILVAILIVFSAIHLSGEYEKDYCEKCKLRYHCEAYQSLNYKICQYFEPEN